MTALDPSQFRSPLLEPLPPEPAGLGRRTLLRRRLILALALAVAALGAVAVELRWVPAAGPARALYRLHDEVYLPLKGYAFTWLYPGSWIYLLAGLTLALFALIAVVWKRPLTPPWHLGVGRWLLGRRFTRPALRRWNRLYRAFVRGVASRYRHAAGRPSIHRGLAWLSSVIEGPTLLEEVVDDERRAALARLDTLDPAGSSAVPALATAADLAVFAARVSAPAGGSVREALGAVVGLDEALLRLDLLRAAREDPAAAVEKLRTELETEISALLRPIVATRPGKPDFSLPALATDLALALDLANLPDGDEGQRRRHVLDAVEARRRALDESRRRLERAFAYVHRRRPRSAALPSSGLSAPRGALEARLAVDVALFAALRFAVPRMALAFLESLEGLRFALLTSDAEADDVRAALERLPRPADYRICAWLLDRLRSAAGDLDDAIERRSRVLAEGDLRLVDARRDDLFAAAADSR